MVENKKVTDYLKDYRPEASDFSVPAGISRASRRRRSRSYSTINYEWAVYRSKGKPLSEYTPLPTFQQHTQDNYAFFKRRGKTRLKSLLEIKRVREAASEARRFERFFFQSLNSAAGLLRANLYSGFSYLLFENYFYKNLFFYWLVWLNFYFQEYAFVQFTLYFPILDWLTANVFFVWPVHIDLYFLRFAFSVFFVVFCIFFYFQRRFEFQSRFDLLIGLAHPIFFFGSIFAYHLTGAAPFLFFVAGSLLFFIIYNFYYFIPRGLIAIALAVPLFLPAPRVAPVLLLAAPRYFYPFRNEVFVSSRSLASSTFTRFPFTSFNVAGLAAHIRFVRTVLNHSTIKVSTLSRTAPLFRFAQFDSKLSLAGTTSFDTFYKFNPYDYYENVVNAAFWREEDHAQFSERIHEEEDYIKEAQKIITPTLINNVAFFAGGYRHNAISLYRNHFTSQFDTFGAGSAPRLPAWQMALLNDPYFELYIWLKNVGPRYARPHPQSALYLHHFGSFSRPVSNSPYPLFTVMLETIYGFFENLFDRLTLHRFVIVRTDASNLDVVYAQFVRLASVTAKFSFHPSPIFIKRFLKFVLAFERRLDRDDRFLLLGSARTTRYELIHFIGLLYHNFAARLAKESRSVFSVVGQIYLRAIIRALDRLLFRLSQPILSYYAFLVN